MPTYPERIKRLEPFWGSWTLDAGIGEGSYGRVYRIKRQIAEGEALYAALKWIQLPQSQGEVRNLKREHMTDDDIRLYYHKAAQVIQKEILLMSKLRSSRHVVSIEDYQMIERTGEIGWDILIRMELLTPLPDRFEQGMTVGDVATVGMHLCDALTLCESHRIIHRDIKPDNIFCNEYGDYKLGDFGVARQIEHTQTHMSIKGTPLYMAPEVYKGAVGDASVDQYSLALVMHRLLNGQLIPFTELTDRIQTHEEREAALMQRLQGTPIPPPLQGNTKLQKAICKACSFSPRKRFANAAAFRAALEEASQNGGMKETLISRPTGRQMRSKRSSFATPQRKPKNKGALPRKTWVAIGILSASLALSAAAILWSLDVFHTKTPSFSVPSPITAATAVPKSTAVAITTEADMHLFTPTPLPAFASTITSLMLDARSATQLYISWNELNAGSYDYTVSYRPINDTQYKSLSTNNRYVSIMDFEPGVTYSIRVGTTEGNTVSQTVTMPTVKPTTAPTPTKAALTSNAHSSIDGFSVSSKTGTSLSITWKENSAGTYKYTVVYKKPGESDYTTAGITSKTSYSIDQLSPNTTYYIKVTASGGNTIFNTVKTDDAIVAITNHTANMRKASSLRADIVKTYPEETTVEILEEIESEGVVWYWVRAVSDGKEGYMRDFLLDTGAPTSEQKPNSAKLTFRQNRNVMIAVGAQHVAGLKYNGKVLSAGNDRMNEWDENWSQIIAIAKGTYFTIGLKQDGTMVYAGSSASNTREYAASIWHHLVAISAEGSHIVALTSNGTVVAADVSYVKSNVENWTGLIAAAAGDEHTVGLKSNGTVVAAGDNAEGQCNVSRWKNIIAIDGGYTHTVGLKADGTVVATGSNQYGECDVGNWKDIIAVAAGGHQTIGLKADGTVVVTGSVGQEGQDSVAKWQHIVAVTAGSGGIMGLESDGTVLVYGRNANFHFENAEKWTGIMLPVSAESKNVALLKSLD